MAFSGTSAAAPLVAGVAALLKSYQPELTGEDIEQVLKLTARNLHAPATGFDAEHGYGFVRAGLALDEIAPPRLLTHFSATPTDPYSIGPLIIADSSATLLQRTFVGVPGLPSETYVTQCRRYRMTAGIFFPFAYAQAPRIWIRSATTEGWRDTVNFNAFYEVPWARAFGVTETNALVETYVYRILKADDPNVTLGWFPVEPSKARIDFTLLGIPASTTNVAIGPPAPASLVVYPNPVAARARFALTLESGGPVRARIIDVAGRHVSTLLDAVIPSGSYDFTWDAVNHSGRRSAAGVYFVRIETASGITTRRFALLGGR